MCSMFLCGKISIMAKSNSQKHKIKSLKGRTIIADYAANAFAILGSKTAARKAISAGELFLNNQSAKDTDFVRNGDFLELKLAKAKKVKKIKGTIELEIVFEDDYLIIINKPGGIAVNGNRNKTVENAVVAIAKKSKQADALPNPRAAHRIDVPTKGLVLLAKTKTALVKINKAFQNNEVKKTYFAVVHGKTIPKGRIEAPIQGKPSITDFQTVKNVRSRMFKNFSLVKLFPITGRTHQLRIHLNDEGHLIVGDKEYAQRQRTILGKGLFLCACRLAFTHPITEENLDISINSPARFEKLLEREEERF